MYPENNKQMATPFFIVPGRNTSILGKQSCQELNLVRLVETAVEENKYDSLLSKYEGVFEGLRCLAGKHRITVDQAVKLVIHPCRMIPFIIRNQYKEELERMEREQVIVKVMEPTDWVNSAGSSSGVCCSCTLFLLSSVSSSLFPISSPPVLRFYDPKKPIKLSSDASKDGLGCSDLTTPCKRNGNQLHSLQVH